MPCLPDRAEDGPPMTLPGTTAAEDARIHPCADVIDLTRYPIHDLDGAAGRAMIGSCRDALAADGACTLPGFLGHDAVRAMIDCAGELDSRAWASDQTHTVYLDAADGAVPDDHPRARQVRSAKRGIAYDYIPADAPMRRVYASDDMTRFVAAVLGKDVLYRSADPLDAFQITTMNEGDELGWHFDRSEFSVTVMYQMADAGGDFDYHLGLRSDSDDNFA